VLQRTITIFKKTKRLDVHVETPEICFKIFANDYLTTRQTVVRLNFFFHQISQNTKDQFFESIFSKIHNPKKPADCLIFFSATSNQIFCKPMSIISYLKTCSTNKCVLKNIDFLIIVDELC
jgi:hypothetical protein